MFVHGSLDRGDSFRRVMRRLPEWNLVSYDRRGYQNSRSLSPSVDLHGHIEDLLTICEELNEKYTRHIVLIGHSFGGDVVLGAALSKTAVTETVDSVGVFEPPMPWLGFRRPQIPTIQLSQRVNGPLDGPLDGSSNSSSSNPTEKTASAYDDVESFFIRMVGQDAWRNLSASAKESRLADGPALIADLANLTDDPPFDVTQLSIPSLFGRGGIRSQEHHRATVEWLFENVPGASIFEIEAAGHGAHISHPNAFASFVRATVAMGAEKLSTASPDTIQRVEK